MPRREVDMSTMTKAADLYMERLQAQEDPIIRKAQERILRAARAVFDAKTQLNHASRELERHPDFLKTARARRKGKPLGPSLTLAWWVHNGIKSALEDALLEDAGDWLFEDANPRRAASNLRLFADTEKADLARFARRQPKRKAALHIVQTAAA